MTKKEWTEKYDKTKKGLSVRIYNGQKCRSTKKKLGKVEYSAKELREWLFEQKNFEELFKRWVDSGYSKWKKPSVDRIDDFIGYKMNNIQLMTWEENNRKEQPKLKGSRNYLAKKKEFYEKNARTKGTFKTICRNQGWDFNDFVETFSEWKKTSQNKRLKTFVYKKKVI